MWPGVLSWFLRIVGMGGLFFRPGIWMGRVVVFGERSSWGVCGMRDDFE